MHQNVPDSSERLLTADAAREIAKDHAPELVAAVEERSELTGIEWASITECVEEEVANVLENLLRPGGDGA